MEMYLVGGIVRDMLLGLPPKDHDFTVVMPAGNLFPFNAMRARLQDRGVEIFVETPEFLTIRGRFAKNDPEFPGIAADFVLARKDSTKKECEDCNGTGILWTCGHLTAGPDHECPCRTCKGEGAVTASDGRRPDYVEPGTLADDLARRDFTVNAMALIKGVNEYDLVDLFGGQEDLENMKLRFVGDPMTRIREDALRVMRAYRFCVTKGFTFDYSTYEAIENNMTEVCGLLRKVSEERRADELSKMFRYDTIESLNVLEEVDDRLRAAIFAGRVRLDSTLKDSKVKYV